MSSVTFETVSKRWGNSVAVSEFSLEVPDGQFLVILGPSGCGKTTSMRMVAGLEKPSAGHIRIGQDDVTDREPGERDVAMVFQSYGLYPQMSVYENIRFPLRARRVPRAEHDARVRRAAAMVELSELLDRKPGALSGGQRQRVALARAIVRSPRVFLMDEPLSNLDARLRVSMRAQIKALHETLRTTTIYVTHDQLEAMTLAERVVVMNAGRVEQVGTPREIYEDPATLFVAGFVGSPSMNLIDGEIAEGQFRAEGVEMPCAASLVSGASVLGVRPEDLVVVDDDENASLRGRVRDVELIGDASLLIIEAGAQLIVVKTDKDSRARPGDRVKLLSSARPFLFDRPSGKRLQ